MVIKQQLQVTNFFSKSREEPSTNLVIANIEHRVVHLEKSDT